MKLFDNAFSPYAFKVRAVLYDPFFNEAPGWVRIERARGA